GQGLGKTLVEKLIRALLQRDIVKSVEVGWSVCTILLAILWTCAMHSMVSVIKMKSNAINFKGLIIELSSKTVLPNLTSFIVFFG
ncbi:hypothetical protein L195_g037231, partial [Trifolium pratense]